MTNAVIEIENVTFSYLPYQASPPVLEDVSLRVEGNDFLGIIGPNGGGKTTLLKIMLGLLEPQQGQVRVFGRPPRLVRHRIGYVPQRVVFNTTVPATVMDVVLAGRLHYRPWGPWYKPADIAAAQEALRRAGIAELAGRQISTLSGGQQQRVLIARALAADSQLLLLDEPMSGVDTAAEQSLIDLLHELNQTVTIVMVSHDISFVSRHLKHIACLNRRLVWQPVERLAAGQICRFGDNRLQIEHGSRCPLGDPGCRFGCKLPEEQHSQ